MRLIHFFLFIGCVWAAEEQVCTAQGECFADEEAMGKYYAAGTTEKMYIGDPHYHSFGEDQKVAGDQWRDTLDNVERTREYMVGVFNNQTLDNKVKYECKCRHELCSFWATIGECEANPTYMLLQCAPSCQTCHQLDFQYRCPYDKDAPTIWGPGDMNRMFERITTEEYYKERYQPTIYSKPPEGPWVVTLDNVATSEECQHMIELGAKKGYKRSKDVGKKKFDGTYDAAESKTRTSSNAWCVDDCWEDEIHQKVLRKVENITGIPDINSEYWQLLQYQETQFYGQHHDYIPHHTERAQGVRIMTSFMYLNEVEEGGGTHFSKLGITVTPKAGRVLLWPSVLDEDPNRKDPRTDHEALPVIKGVKYAANAWIHQRDFKTPFATGCI